MNKKIAILKSGSGIPIDILDVREMKSQDDISRLDELCKKNAREIKDAEDEKNRSNEMRIAILEAKVDILEEEIMKMKKAIRGIIGSEDVDDDELNAIVGED